MSSPSPRHGFTLIELLVVISIIAILASMLLPAVGMIRDLALTQKCTANQRQFQIANLVYAEDNDGIVVPVSTFTFPADPAAHWFQWSYNRSYVQNMEYDNAVIPIPKGLFCPAVSYDIYYAIQPGVFDPGAMVYNLPVHQGTDHESNLGNWYGSYPIDKLPSKASKVAFFDGDGWWAGGIAAGGNYWSSNVVDLETAVPGLGGQITVRHRDKLAVSYWDGHAGTLPGPELRAWTDAGNPYQTNPAVAKHFDPFAP